MTLVIMLSPLTGLCFSMNLCLHLRSFLLRADWWKSHSSVNGEPQEIWGWNSSCKLSFLFLPCYQCTWRACSQTIVIVSRETTSKFEGNLSKLEHYNTLWVYYNKLYLMNNLTIFLLQPWNRKNSLGSPRHDQFIGRNRYEFWSRLKVPLYIISCYVNLVHLYFKQVTWLQDKFDNIP